MFSEYNTPNIIHNILDHYYNVLTIYILLSKKKDI